MSYTLHQFGTELLLELNDDFDVVRVSRWAYEKYISNCRDVDQLTRAAMMQIVAMDEGPEFEMNESELRKFAHDLRGTQNF